MYVDSCREKFEERWILLYMYSFLGSEYDRWRGEGRLLKFEKKKEL